MYEQIARNKRRTIIYIGLFFLAWLGIGAIVGELFAVTASQPTAGSGSAVGDIVFGVTLAAFIAAAGIAFTLRSGSRLVLSVAGAKPADRKQYAQLHGLVEALALGDGLPTPAVYVVEDPSPNAFATGMNPGRSAVTVTTGLLAMMDREELEGVLSHEMSHIKNYDTRLLLVVSTLIGLAALLAGLVWRSAFFMRSRGLNGAQLMLLVFAAGALLSVVGFVLGPVIRLALSRRRESLADASGVELSRNPAGLLSALRKLQANDTPLAHTNHATAAMCIDDPLQHHAGRMHRLFDTHPPIADRIAALERMTQGLTV
ncbi:zinc metalloprotease HtpX [Catenulispora yoronensis]|uniref:Protease HtpX homolog n=1 Tax=Catenulispora yoronensis TaxID=450799 RepID=A0ABN2V625_9ACTN